MGAPAARDATETPQTGGTEPTGAAAGVSAVTTAIGFGSLLAVESEGLRSIGWVAVIGIACTTLCTTALISAFATLKGAPNATS